MTEVKIDLTFILLFVMFVFLLMMILLTLVFIKALFKFPSLRKKIWVGITNGDHIPHQDDFQRTAQLFWSFVLGTGVVIFFCLWAAFPSPEWHIIVPSISLTFLGCIGLKSFNKSH